MNKKSTLDSNDISADVLDDLQSLDSKYTHINTHKHTVSHAHIEWRCGNRRGWLAVLKVLDPSNLPPSVPTSLSFFALTSLSLPPPSRPLPHSSAHLSSSSSLSVYLCLSLTHTHTHAHTHPFPPHCTDGPAQDQSQTGWLAIQQQA